MDLRVLRATLRKNLLILYRAYPVSFMVGNLLTGIYTSVGAWFLYHLMFGGKLSADFVEKAGTSDYMSYVITGCLVYLFVTRTCLNVSRSLITELREGTYESLMIAPFRRAEYFLGNMLVQTVTTSGEVLVSTVAAIPFGLRFSGWNMGSFLWSMLLSLYAFFAVSMVLGCIMLYTRDTYISQNTLFTFLFLVCGITFPAEYLPVWLQRMTDWIPVKGAVNLIRASTLLGRGLREQADTACWVLGVSTVYLTVGFFMMKKTEKHALEKLEG